MQDVNGKSNNVKMANSIYREGNKKYWRHGVTDKYQKWKIKNKLSLSSIDIWLVGIRNELEYSFIISN